ncbi:MAG: hypothetical protein VKL42_08800 [Snowella sp.]|nr:hypothetical protein [Snowella sp.]
MTQTPIDPNAILISDRDRQQLLDFLQWLRTTRPDLVEKCRNPYQAPEKKKALNQLAETAYDLAIVNPSDLHGHYRVTPALKKSAKATAAVMTGSNLIDALGNFSCFLFASKSLPFVLALGTSVTMTVVVIKMANALCVASSHGHKGRWGWAITALVCGLIPINILQTAATGVGAEIFNNAPELAQLRASDSLQAILKTKEEKLSQALANPPQVITECQREKQALETMARRTDLEEKAFQSRYVRIYGTFQNQNQPLNLPLEQLPLCIRANRLQTGYDDNLQLLKQDISNFKSQRAAMGNDLDFLKQIAPAQYKKTFVESKSWFFLPENDQVEVRSGIELVTLGTRNFFGKLQRGQWNELGLNLFLTGLSVITSLAAIAMAVSFSLSEDTQRSYDHQEKERVEKWLRQMRLTLSTLHQEQVEQLKQSQQPSGLRIQDELNNRN